MNINYAIYFYITNCNMILKGKKVIIISDEIDTLIVLPINTTKETLDKVMKSLFEIEAHLKPANLDNLSKISGISKNNLSTVNTFLEAIYALKKTSGREFMLTEIGSKFAKAISWNLDNDANLAFRELLLNYELTKQALSIIRVKEDITQEELQKRIGSLSGKKDNKAVSAAAKNFIKFLEIAEIIEIDGENIKISMTKKDITSSEAQSDKKHTITKKEIHLDEKDLSTDKIETLKQIALEAPAWERIPTEIDGVFIVNPEKDMDKRKKNPLIQLEINDGSKRQGYYLRHLDDLIFLINVVTNPKLKKLLAYVEKVNHTKKKKNIEKFTLN